MEYAQHYYKYSSGLRLVFVQTPELYTAKLRVMFTVGAEDEEVPRGVAHLVEHSIFKGTKKLSQEEISEAFNKISADIDASTSSETTSYMATFPKIRFTDVCKLYSHILTESVFDEEEIEKEKAVIVEEILMHEDMPDQACFDQLIRLMFGDVGIGNDIAGKIELLKGVSPADLKAFHKDYYNNQNMIVEVVGDYNFEDVKQTIEQFFVVPFAKNNKLKGKTKKWSLLSLKEPKKELLVKDTLQDNVMMGYRCPSYVDMERFDFGLIGFIIGGSMNSRLFKKIRNELALCYMISSFEVAYRNNGFMAINFVTSPKNTKKCINAVNEVIADIIKNGVSEAEFVEAKNLTIDRYMMSLDMPKGNIKYIAYKDELLDTKMITNYLKNCTRAKSVEVFKKYIAPEDVFISVVSGQKKCVK